MDDGFHRLEILGRGRHDIGLEAAQTLRVDLELRFEATTTTEVEVSRLRSRATATIVADVWRGALAEPAARVDARVSLLAEARSYRLVDAARAGRADRKGDSRIRIRRG